MTLPIDCLRHRRQRLATQIQSPVLLWAGDRPSRNFPANKYPFRASSHFLYFAGQALEHAVIHLQDGRLTLFLDEPPAHSALWHGSTPKRDEIAANIGADAAYPLVELSNWSQNAVTIGVPSSFTQQAALLNRPITIDRALAQAIVALRLTQDKSGLEEMRAAVDVTVAAHLAGFKATKNCRSEAQVRAAMEQVILAADMTTAYNSIVTVQGEVLHNEQYYHALHSYNLLLADVGAETSGGWAADVTRTWPVSGQFSATQKALYEVVLTAQTAAIAAIKPGVEYRDIHLLACLNIAAGLVDVGILKGNPESLVEMDAHALFFPHGIGHLLGLDVHDMEDLGDLAGYEAGRTRSDRFGLGYLRLDRPLVAGMVVTIEPGFYQVPALIEDPVQRDRFKTVVNWEKLAGFKDVQGIRIEDDILVTDSGCEVLTAALPKEVKSIEAIIAG
jgi:Xaa-Pro aminopeptidase